MSDNLRRKREEETFTIGEAIEAAAELEETAAAVLGASDNDNCSYDKGYVKRQALYSCLTCNPAGSPNSARAGICLACSLKCHDGHNLVELYTKRNFRCDCGNSKFSESRCSLQPNKDLTNEKNTYNQNFDGVYCICSRPYPDPDEEEEEEDEMIQCVICEDWLHGRHTLNDSVDLETEIDEAEFICESCTKKNDFLVHYASLQLIGNVSEAVEVDISKVAPQEEPTGVSCDTDSVTLPSSNEEPVAVDTAETAKVGNVPVSQFEQIGVTELEDASSQDSGIGSGSEPLEMDSDHSQSSATKEEICMLSSTLKERTSFSGGTWWSNGWRKQLCQCNLCKENYGKLNVAFLIDSDDSLDVYEAKGKANGLALEEIGQNFIQSALSNLDRVQQIEVIHGFNEMKEALGQFLKGLAEANRVVTAEDINTFFAELRANKRRRVDDVYVPDSCR